MKQMTIPVKENVKIEIKASGDLSVQGTHERILTAVVESGDCLKISEEHDRLMIRATDDCRLVVPETSIVTVRGVGGNLLVTSISNRMIIGKVGGDLALELVNGASVETVGGDLGFKNISGTLEIARVGGDLDGDEAVGITSRAVGGDVTLINVDGVIDLSAGGNVAILTSKNDLPAMTIRSGEDLKLVVPPGASAQLEMHSGGEKISVHACGQEADWKQETAVLPLGDGGALLKLTAGDEILVTDNDTLSMDIDDILGRTKDEWEDFAIDLKKAIQQGLDAASDSIEQISRQAEKAGEKARISVEMATNRKMGKWINKNRKNKLVGFSYDEPVQAVSPKKSGASEEERMLVLRMLQEKKISVEEAEKLLNALDK